MAVVRQPALHRTIRQLRRAGRQQSSKVLVIGNWQIIEEDGDLVAVDLKTGSKTVLVVGED